MKKFIVVFIKDGTGQVNLVEALSEEMAERIFVAAQPDAEICRVREATQSEINKPGIPVITNWKCTDIDNYQYCRQISNTKYELIQMAEYANGKYSIAEASIIDVSDYMENGEYDDSTVSIIKIYYQSVEQFKASYPDEESRNQVLAEMIYETFAAPMLKYVFQYEEEVKNILNYYMKTGKYAEVHECYCNCCGFTWRQPAENIICPNCTCEYSEENDYIEVYGA